MPVDRGLSGKLAPEPPRDVAELEAEARGSGVIAAIARAHLRMLRTPLEGLLPPGVERQDALGTDR